MAVGSETLAPKNSFPTLVTGISTEAPAPVLLLY